MLHTSCVVALVRCFIECALEIRSAVPMASERVHHLCQLYSGIGCPAPDTTKTLTSVNACRWPMNPSDFFLQSVLPLEWMFWDGVFDRNVKFTPVLDGMQQPPYFQWWLSPFTHHKARLCFLHGAWPLS